MFNEYGGPDNQELITRNTPQPAPGELGVKVYAAGVNPLDWKVRSGVAGTPRLRPGAGCRAGLRSCGTAVHRRRRATGRGLRNQGEHRHHRHGRRRFPGLPPAHDAHVRGSRILNRDGPGTPGVPGLNRSSTDRPAIRTVVIRSGRSADQRRSHGSRPPGPVRRR